MPGYQTRILELDIAGHPYRLRALSDRQQFADPDGHGERMGVSPAQWSLFGQLWPASRLLAQAVHGIELRERRILEIGCGLGLASLVLQRRGANVVASDAHPLADAFLAYNAALNGLPAVHYRQMRWDRALPSLGRFDLIVASDVLYERDNAVLLAGVVERHALDTAEVLVADPGRDSSAPFTRLLAEQGFVVERTRCAPHDKGSVRGHLLHYRRLAGSNPPTLSG